MIGRDHDHSVALGVAQGLVRQYPLPAPAAASFVKCCPCSSFSACPYGLVVATHRTGGSLTQSSRRTVPSRSSTRAGKCPKTRSKKEERARFGYVGTSDTSPSTIPKPLTLLHPHIRSDCGPYPTHRHFSIHTSDRTANREGRRSSYPACVGVGPDGEAVANHSP